MFIFNNSEAAHEKCFHQLITGKLYLWELRTGPRCC